MKVYKYGPNVDTDVIIPARHLNDPSPAALASHCMEDIDINFASTVEPGDIVVAGSNFGCGSSREHAAWARAGYGARVVVSSSFADIHRNNLLNCFVLPVVVSREFQQELFQTVKENPKAEIKVDVPNQTITNLTTGNSEQFTINSYKKHCWMNAYDDIEFLLSNTDKIEKWETANSL